MCCQLSDPKCPQAGWILTSLWTLMNSRGSPLAQGGRMQSPSLVPFCLAPGGSTEANRTFRVNIQALGKRRRLRSRLPTLTQVEVVGVEQELGQVEELGDELLDVGHVVFGGGEPSFTHTVEHPVGQVEMTPLVATQEERFTIRHLGQKSRGLFFQWVRNSSAD